MAITNGYADLPQFKLRASIPAGSAHDDDSERAIEAASRVIDNFCGRRFYPDTAASARYYTALDTETLLLPVDDISSTTGLIVKSDDDWDGTFENTWTLNGRTASYGFMLEPTNAAAMSKPFTRLHAIASSFPTVAQGIEVTAKWGFPAVPTDIMEACLILAGRYYKRKDTPFGVMGTEGVGVIVLPKVDPDVGAILSPWRRMDRWG